MQQLRECTTTAGRSVVATCLTAVHAAPGEFELEQLAACAKAVDDGDHVPRSMTRRLLGTPRKLSVVLPQTPVHGVDGGADVRVPSTGVFE